MCMGSQGFILFQRDPAVEAAAAKADAEAKKKSKKRKRRPTLLEGNVLEIASSPADFVGK